MQSTLRLVRYCVCVRVSAPEQEVAQRAAAEALRRQRLEDERGTPGSAGVAKWWNLLWEAGCNAAEA
jgi:hypothetical protein